MTSRRRFLAASGAVAAAGLSGCLAELGRLYTSNEPPVVSNRPDEVYVPTHTEGMRMVGSADAGDLRVGVFYSYPHRFWVMADEGDGFGTSKMSVEAGDDVHLMATVWDPETGVVVPDTGLSLEIARDGDLVSEEVVYAMLSQRMGFHYGSNFGLDGDGTYEVTVDVGAPSLRLFGDLVGRFGSPASATLDFEYSAGDRDDIPYTMLDDQQGDPGAVRPMEMDGLPLGRGPETLPGTALGGATTGSLRLVGTALDADRFGDDPYLAVFPLTPYNRLLVPRLGLTATVESGGSTRFDGRLEPGLDADLGFHYGASVPGLAGDDATADLAVDVPPQVARHEGYETAFLEFDPVRLG
ncbi:MULTISPECIES: iron transporter [unclassified Haloferax]|uniref:iron transporter n=1 Tax=unclassified Haloferax TaxID=2625095 RepID=UPI000E258ED0|nr:MULTISPECIES: iron transporter [unclassified Haloferax]RDZ37684.1 Tat pathway signal protein [Haloferax sp. Atlit-24N]RLM38480.1 Tat pathway signal protein [Haloferax sp. Atlit-109R]RLM46425.1 Tat pathway signal protein [Haloferax sp. Atlit-105R]